MCVFRRPQNKLAKNHCAPPLVRGWYVYYGKSSENFWCTAGTKFGALAEFSRDGPPGRQISRNDDDLYPTCHCICTEDRGEFYQCRKNLNPRPKAAEFFLMSNTVFPEFLAPQNGGWLTTVTRNKCCRSRTLPKTTS